MNSGQVVGSGGSNASGGDYHALLWSNPGGNLTDLNPNGFVTSQAYNTNGINQVGFGAIDATSGNVHALLWSGTAASAIDLNPAGFDSSEALEAVSKPIFADALAD